MTNKRWYILVAIPMVTLLLFLLSTPWRENRSLNQFAKENLRGGTSAAQVAKLLGDNGYDLTMHENKLAPHLVGKRWIIARKAQRFLFWGEAILTINVYFDKGSDQLLQYDAYVVLPDLL